MAGIQCRGKEVNATDAFATVYITDILPIKN
jgi:hypothetical protein